MDKHRIQRAARLALVAAWASAPARADAAFWEHNRRVGVSLGVSLTVRVGPPDDRARFGAAVDGGYQWFWQDRPYDHPGLEPTLAPILAANARLGWQHPFTWAEITASAGAEYPLAVFDGGWIPAVGALAGGGLAVSSDGFAGPVAVGTLRGPLSTVRLEAGVRDGGWHAPRASVGPDLPLYCCYTYQ